MIEEDWCLLAGVPTADRDFSGLPYAKLSSAALNFIEFG